MTNKFALEVFKRTIIESLDYMEYESIRQLVKALSEANEVDGSPLGYTGGGMTYSDNKDIEDLIDRIWDYLENNYKEALDEEAENTADYDYENPQTDY